MMKLHKVIMSFSFLSDFWITLITAFFVNKQLILHFMDFPCMKECLP